MRPGQQHNKRGRGRNRHRSSGGGSGGGGSGGGNPLSRVYDSNGPDVKVRGTAQTVAEKYLQLARDARSSSDHVMAESYFQHAEHYLRILSEAQGYQQQQFRRPGEEFDDEDGDDGDGEGDDNRQPQIATTGMGEQPDIQGEPPEFENARPQQQQNSRQNRDNQGNRDGQQPNRFRPRWQDRRDRPPNGGETREQPVPPRGDEPPREQAAAPVNGNSDEAPQWEAPSFLRRPAAIADTAPEAVEEAVVEKRPRVGRPRKERPVEDAPAPETQGE
jgi:hypothetical protein